MVASVLRNNLEARKVFTIGSFVNQQNSWLYFFFLPVAEVTSSLPVIHSPFFPSNPILVFLRWHCAELKDCTYQLPMQRGLNSGQLIYKLKFGAGTFERLLKERVFSFPSSCCLNVAAMAGAPVAILNHEAALRTEATF